MFGDGQGGHERTPVRANECSVRGCPQGYQQGVDNHGGWSFCDFRTRIVGAFSCSGQRARGALSQYFEFPPSSDKSIQSDCKYLNFLYTLIMRTFVTADTHWGHQRICEFSVKHGDKLRPWDSADEMDAAMVQLWNETVRPKDKVIHLGDVAIHAQGVATMGLLHGQHILVKGNHDRHPLAVYTPYFYDIMGSLSVDKFILTHIPVSSHQQYRYRGNIHGHLHSESLPDPWYQCVSVEQTGFKPILLEEVLSRYSDNHGRVAEQADALDLGSSSSE